MVSALFPLTAEGAGAKQRGKRLVGPVDLTLQADGLTVMIGPNGAGKTSLLKLLHGIVRIAEGRVSWACSEEEARARQAFVFQTPVMLRRSVQDNIAYPLRVAGTPRAEARARAVEMATRVGLKEVLPRWATALSGGERQKLALARALVRDPDVLFLDEPCASLDGRAMREIEAILKDASRRGTRIIMSTHDMGQARRLATEVVFMLRGKVHEFTPAESFFTHAKTAQARAFLNGDIVE